MRGSGRRSGRQDVSAHILHDEQVSQRVRADSVRQLCGDGDDRRRAVHTRLVRHGRPRGLRPPQAAQLSANGRVPRVLQRGQSVLVRERQGEVGARDTASLPEDALPARRHPGRLARGDEHSRQACQEQAQARHQRAGRTTRQGAQGHQVRRMLGAHTGWFPFPCPMYPDNVIPQRITQFDQISNEKRFAMNCMQFISKRQLKKSDQINVRLSIWQLAAQFKST